VSQKNILDSFDCKLKTNYQILIIFGTNIPDTTCHQMAVQFPTPPWKPEKHPQHYWSYLE